ncbi:hypothetical protein ES703_45266 [subsurface metagenome]
MKTEELWEKIKGRVDWQFKGVTNLLPSAYEDSKNLIADQALQDCNQWLEKRGASHKVKCPHCSWSQFTDEVVGMSPCYECNSTGYIFRSLRLEVGDENKD